MSSKSLIAVMVFCCVTISSAQNYYWYKNADAIRLQNTSEYVTLGSGTYAGGGKLNINSYTGKKAIMMTDGTVTTSIGNEISFSVPYESSSFNKSQLYFSTPGGNMTLNRTSLSLATSSGVSASLDVSAGDKLLSMSSSGGTAHLYPGTLDLSSSGGRNGTIVSKTISQSVSGVEINKFNSEGVSFIKGGPVGIGTSSPASGVMLDVNGAIKTTKVMIKDWAIEAPDYVFADSYHLRSLSEVESFIEENNHLPEVPSASKMKEDGVDLSELNMTLLKKVEELTLYVIDQNKKIAKLEERLDSQD